MCNFQVSFTDSDPRVKHSPFCYSASLDKLYVQIDKCCPVKIEANIPTDQLDNFRIRSWIVFTELPDNAVHCCSSHKKPEKAEDHSGDGIIYCDHPSVVYEDFGPHHSAVVQLSSLAPETHLAFCSSVNYKFTCFSSCISLRRRPTALIIALEDIRLGVEVGRRSVDLRICSCPAHDVTLEEEGEAIDFDDFNSISISE